MSLAAQLEGIVGGVELSEHPALPGCPIASPASEEQAGELLALARKDKLPLVLLGNGSKLGWSVLAGEPRFGLSTRELSGVIEFEPGDGVITARAGTTMGELERVTAEAQLAVTPNLPREDNATLGGFIGAGQSGFDRLQHGAGRLHVLGTRVMKLDGSTTLSGGRLVKNVSGYDLHRLYAGSFGSLALILEASLRLAPLPEQVRVLTCSSARAEDLILLLKDIQGAGVGPRAIQLENRSTPGTWKLHVVLSGIGPHVKYEQQRLASAMHAAQLQTGAEALELVRELRNLEPDSTAEGALHVTSRPSSFREMLGILFETLGHQARGRLVAHPALATIDVQLETDALPTKTLVQLRERLQPLAGHATLRGPKPLTAQYLASTEDPVRRALQKRLRRTFDPVDLFCTRPPLGGP